jgi:toxin ParE1/3/4
VAYRILWSDSALDRTVEFFDFIAEDNPAAARRTLQGLFNRVDALAEHPLLGRRLSKDVDPNLRRLVAGSYVVIYRVNKARKKIDIIAVRHSRQRSLPQEE